MKRFLLLTIAFIVFYVTRPLSAEGQTFPNFALGGDSFTPSGSVVRTVNNQKVIASYWDSGSRCYHLARVGLTDIISAKLDDHHEIADIRIMGDDIFFCGMDRSNYRAFLGHATVTGIESMTPHIEIMNFYVDNATITRLWRLAAYTDPTGATRLVAVGDFWYTGSGLLNVPACPSPGTCQSTFAVECTYSSGNFNAIDNRVFYDNTNYEYACDVVETDNYVAVVTFPAADELIIHPCKKSSVAVLPSLDNFYYYKVPPSKVAYYGCKMKGDTIAVASVFNDGPGTDNMQVRVIDLATMNMPCAQTFSLLDKDDICEMAYLPDIQRLVLLTNHTYTPLTLLIHTFCILKPYETAFPYNMEKIYDINRRSFTSLDRLSTKHIVAAGGDYWIMKDASLNNPASTCYKVENQWVKELDISTPLTRNHLFYGTNLFPPSPTATPCNETYSQTTMTVPCITP
ncbi:MAG: hypothetical protein IKG81_07555 [Bacteroidales bacterium]|nr:hypothetical protein [Bacteroidales bacterium]